MSADLTRLPIRSPVLELRQESGRIRVTFKRLAAIYYLMDSHPDHESIVRALERSAQKGEEVAVTYDLKTKAIAGLA